MKTVVIAFEDQYYPELFTLIKRLRRDLGLPGMALFGTTVRGTGGFVNEIRKILRMPPGEANVRPDLVVCLGDADRPANLLPSLSADLASPLINEGGAMDQWIVRFEGAWREHLLKKGPVATEDHGRVRTICLRWSKESLLVASPGAILDYAAKRERRDALEALLNECRPSPLTLADQEFGVRYRSPGQCLNGIFQVIEGRKYKKGRDDEDLLRDHISPNPEHRGQLLRRCPDLGRLLAVLV